jgi:chitinase
MPRLAQLMRRRGLALTAALAIPLGLAIPAASATSPSQTPGASDVRSGYYTQWSVYSGFTPKSVVDNGDAAHINTINYAFINVAPNTAVAGSPIECSSIDPWADWQTPYYDASNSVNGQNDSGPLHGNFNQLLELKAKYPNLRIVASLGGYTLSDWFSNASLTKQARQHLVQSCVNMLISGNLPGLPAGAAKGIFDGIDIDWEYPGAAGNHTVTSTGDPTARPEDTANFTALLQEFRTQLDQAGHVNHANPHYLLTAALSASPAKAALLQVSKITHILDRLDVMTYDFHGPWEATGPTDFQSNLFPSPNPLQPANNRFSIEDSVNAYLGAGADRSKVIVGVPFYGHGWTGVADGGTHGLYQPATGPTADGSPTWKAVQKLGYQPYRDPVTGGYWVYDTASTNMIVIDDPSQIVQKMKYVNDRKLGGAFFWSLDGDDSAGSLGAAIDFGLGHAY